MSRAGQSKLKEIFGEAIDRRGAQREAFLDAACAGDPDTRRRVEALLAAAEKEGPFLSDATMDVPVVNVKVEAIGTRIGPYKLMQLIGEGGFGSVFLAEQEHPVRRRVALKIIKLGMDTKTVVARFEQERQALAMMDHPGIAKVLDAGATEAGRPYFVMELVKGDPITTYCDKNNLTIPERLELFTQVCHAVQHAHTKGVIHRDLKPSNILVTTQDGRSQARVIDFGIAKATDRRLIDKTIFTEFRQLIGTPEYMSPEQAEGGLDVDTRSDVYSLGVLLYELLAGVTPFDPERLRSAAFGEMQRIIREVDPPSPSTRVSKSVQTLADVAAKRRTEPRRLSAVIRGELDWIVMRALEKDRGRRYDSPGNLAADIARFLSGEAVVAAPASVGYRMRKLVRRHRVGFTAAGFVGVALVAGLGAALWQAGVAARERDGARTSAAAAVVAKNDADARRKETEKVAEFQAAQLRGIDAKQMGDRMRAALLADARDSMVRAGKPEAEVKARQDQLGQLLGDANLTNVALKTLDENILSRATKAVNEQFKDQPVVRADLLQTLSGTYYELGLMDQAAEQQVAALEIRRRVLGNASAQTLESVVNLGELMQVQGKFPEAEALDREAIAMLPKVKLDDEILAVTPMANLAILLGTQRRTAEAEPLLREALDRATRAFGVDDPNRLQVLAGLGGVLTDSGRLVEAESACKEVLDRKRKILGEEDAGTLLAMNNLACVVQRLGRLKEAEAYYREALDRSRRARGDEHPNSVLYVNNLAFVLYLEGKLDEAEPLMRRAMEQFIRVYRKEHWETLQSINNVGRLLQARGKLSEAESFYKEALEGRRRLLGEDHQGTLQSLADIGSLYLAQGRLDEAETMVRDVLGRQKSKLGADHPDTLESMFTLADLLMVRGKAAEAEPLYREALSGFERKLGPGDWRVGGARAGLGGAIAAMERFAEAEPALLDAARAFDTVEGVPPERRASCLRHITALYEAWDRAQPGKGYDVRAKEWKARR